jgi:Domain of unknown function (DUF5710)
VRLAGAPPAAGAAAGSRERDRSGVPGYGRGPGEENTWYQGPRANERPGGYGAAQGGARVFFQVSFDEKDEAKMMGARWDADAKGWYAEGSDEVFALEQRFGRKVAAGAR